MGELRIDEDGTWERTSRYGWALITPSAAWRARNPSPLPPPPDPRIALRTELQAATTIAQLKSVLEKVIG